LNKNVLHIDILRHGETQKGNIIRGAINDALTDFGWSQMNFVIENQNCQWDRIISSPLIRCENYASSLAKKLDIPISLDNGLKEFNFGDWEGRSIKDIAEQDSNSLSKFWKNPMHFSPPNAESFLKFKDRVLSAWMAISETYTYENILLITHGGVIRIILSHIRGYSIEEFQNINVDLASLLKIRIDVTSVNSNLKQIYIIK